MDYEKKYKEALEKANSAYKDEDRHLKATLERIFPELKESEDEKMRKHIIQVFKDYFSGEDTDKCIAWLEKQGEQRSITIDVDKMASKYSHTKDGDFGLPVNCQIRAYIQGVNDVLNLLGIEKQGGQEEPQVYETEDGEIITYSETDGYKVVEPKFKVGDWVTNGMCTFKIASIENGFYYDTNNCGSDIESIDKSYHLWTIDDAAKGDILAYPDGSLVIFKYRLSGLDAGLYMGSVLLTDKITFARTCTILNAKPATEKQCNILFKVLKEAGYEWDNINKKLKKIDSPVLSNSSNTGKDEPTKWSKEDELHIRELESLVKKAWAIAELENDKDTIHKMSDLSFFLKTLKPQLKREWSEEDSRILHNVKAYIGYAAGQRGVKDELFKEANEWLSSLPIGFIYNKNYNEDMVTLLVSELKQIANGNNVPEQYQMEINWLKSLRPPKY